MKKPTLAPPRSHTIGPVEPCGKCGWTNHTTLECWVGTNKCLWCGSTEHVIATCPQWLNTTNVGEARPPPRQGPVPSLHQGPPLQPHQGTAPSFHQGHPTAPVGRSYMISKKETATSSTVVTGTLFWNSLSFCVLFDSIATHSFVSTWIALYLKLDHAKIEVNYRSKLCNNSVIDYPLLYKHVPISLGGFIFSEDLI